jgi:hypothetical protein
MGAWAIEHPELFTVADESSGESYCGCSQEWYTGKWRRMSGCGPTAASNIILYMNRVRCAATVESSISKAECLSIMEEMWRYVTPTVRGVHTTKRFHEGMSGYAASKEMSVRFEVCNLPKNKSRRPGLTEVLSFIEGALEKDCPVAFLNLCNGQELSLDRWHWVTIISLEHAEDGENAVIEVLDEGEVKRLNLSLWYNTTKRGGGFVYLVELDA